MHPSLNQSPCLKNPALLLVISAFFCILILPGLLNPVEAATSVVDAPLPDLDVTFIERQPMYSAYCVDYPWDVPGMPGKPFICPGTETERRWPEPGEIVTFTAHIVNKGDLSSPAFDYAWHIDGAVVKTGSLPALEAGAALTTTCTWPWAHGLVGERLTLTHTVSFSVDPAGLLPESFKTNNSLTDRTDAWSFQIVFTPDMFLAYNVPVDENLPHSAEDWIQKQIRAMNQALNDAVYPATPFGAVGQVRINRILVADEYPPGDRSHDGGWWIADDVRTGAGYYDPESDIDWGMVHELSHQISLIDHYVSNVEIPFNHVLNREGQRMNVGFWWLSDNSIMFGGDTSPYTTPWRYDSHSAGGAKSNFGYRNGFYGAYQFDIPTQNWLHLLDNTGAPVAGVQVDLYRKHNLPHVPADVDNIPEISGQTGMTGSLLLPNLPVNGDLSLPTGHVLHDNLFGMIDIIGEQNRYFMKLSTSVHEEFHWLDITTFNLAFWQGYTDSFTLDMQTHFPASGAPSAPQNLAGKVQGDISVIYWSPGPPEVVSYNVYRLGPPDFQYENIATIPSDTTHYLDTFSRMYWTDYRYYVVTAVDALGRESAFSNHWWAPRIFYPVSLQMEPDGNTLIQDSGTFINFLEVAPSGRYLRIQPVTEFTAYQTHHFTLNPDGWLVVSYPGFGPDDPPSLHLYNPHNEAGFTIGDHGPGKLQNPAGVVWWNPQGYALQGPYLSDTQTLLLSAFDGSFDGAQGEVGTPYGVSFTSGVYGQAALFDDNDVLTYPTADNLLRAKGGIEFWIKPSWNGDDDQGYTFLEVGEAWENRLLILKDGANNLRLIIMDALGEETGVECWVGNWIAGEWHHIAASWQDEWLMLAMDGFPCKTRTFPIGVIPPAWNATMYVGNSANQSQPAMAAMDDLRISNLPRLGNSAYLRLLVVDSAQSRLLALDGLGNLVASFGSPGSGSNQLDDPRGLTLTSAGEVIVVDRNNNRLQILGFDGSSFTFLRKLIGSFNHPTNAAAYQGWIVVADTGNHQIKLLNPAGNLAATYTEPDDALIISAFSAPEGVAVDRWGRILVADTGNNRLAWLHENALPKNFTFFPLVRR